MILKSYLENILEGQFNEDFENRTAIFLKAEKMSHKSSQRLKKLQRKKVQNLKRWFK